MTDAMTPTPSVPIRTYEFIQTERPSDHVGLVRLNRPKALNALSNPLMREVVTALQQFDADDSIGCLVITGSDRAFAAGADIREMSGMTAVDMVLRSTVEIWDQLRGLHKPIIAVVSGYCLGGGCELAMICDMIVASETAQFGQPEINLGVIPGAGGTQRLIRAVGKPIAMEMILNARTLTAAEALQLGLVNRVAPLETYMGDALTLAESIGKRAPIAIRLAKEAINQAYELSLHDGLGFERRNFSLLFASADQKEGMAAFVQKRDPVWKGE